MEKRPLIDSSLDVDLSIIVGTTADASEALMGSSEEKKRTLSRHAGPLRVALLDEGSLRLQRGWSSAPHPGGKITRFAPDDTITCTIKYLKPTKRLTVELWSVRSFDADGPSTNKRQPRRSHYYLGVCFPSSVDLFFVLLGLRICTCCTKSTNPVRLFVVHRLFKKGSYTGRYTYASYL